METGELRARAICSVARALLGMVKPNMRCVFVSWADQAISVRVVYDDDFTQSDIDDVDAIETEMLADFFPDVNVECRAERLASKQRVVPQGNEVMVFMRAECNQYDEP